MGQNNHVAVLVCRFTERGFSLAQAIQLAKGLDIIIRRPRGYGRDAFRMEAFGMGQYSNSQMSIARGLGIDSSLFYRRNYVEATRLRAQGLTLENLQRVIVTLRLFMGQGLIRQALGLKSLSGGAITISIAQRFLSYGAFDTKSLK